MIAIVLCIWIFTVFFSKHKEIDGKLEIPLPKDGGMSPTLVTDPILEEFRVSMELDASTGKTKLMIGSTSVESLGKLEEIIQEEVYRFKKDGKQTNASPITVTYDGDAPEYYNIIPVVINAAPNVPWQDVVNVISICKKVDIGIVFSAKYILPPERD